MAGFDTGVIGDNDKVGMLSHYSSPMERWDVLDLPTPFDPNKGSYRFVWDSDDNFALHGVMSWVDYHRVCSIATCLLICLNS